VSCIASKRRSAGENGTANVPFSAVSSFFFQLRFDMTGRTPRRNGSISNRLQLEESKLKIEINHDHDHDHGGRMR
jgi:hypothetical protein